MTTAITQTTPAATLSPAALYGMWVRGFRSAATRRGYEGAVRDLADFLGASTANLAVELLLSMTRQQANGVVEGYKADRTAKGQASATVAQKVSAVRSLVELAERCGLTDWTLDAKPPEVESLQDTAGCGLEGFKKLLAACNGDSPKARRDRALLRLMFDLGLRGASSALPMDWPDVEFDRGRVWVYEKGKSRKVPKTLAPATQKALREWQEAHPHDHPAVFVNLDAVSRRGRLTGQSLRKIVAKLAAKAGIDASPHDLRRASGTLALDRTNGDIRKVQKFMGHANPRTTMVYDTNRRDFQGEVSRLIADE
jgi:integrase/recombinase XerC